MKEFILLLLFGRSVLLTPTPISIGPSCVVLSPSKVLHVINGNAALEIEIQPGTNGAPNIINVINVPKVLQKLYPPGTITAQLFRENGSIVDAINTDVGTGKDSYSINMRPPVSTISAKKSLPAYIEGDKFTKVSICSKHTLSDVQVYWQTAME